MVDWRLNFKFFILLSLVLFLTGCGVKADPVRYTETAIDSYVQSYTGSEPTSEEQENTKKSESATAPIQPNP